MKPICLIMAGCLALGLAGCFTVDTATIAQTGEEHVFMRNYGWRLFGCIPLVSGNADEHGATGIAFFRDDVTAEKVQTRFASYAGGREILSPAYHNYANNVITVFSIPIPYVLCYKEVSLSGTLK